MLPSRRTHELSNKLQQNNKMVELQIGVWGATASWLRRTGVAVG